MRSHANSTLDLRAWIEETAWTTWGVDRDVAIIAVDGLGFAEASDILRPSSAWCVRTVFPTNSFPGWLSALTGTDVATHGVPGVVFRDPTEGTAVNLLRDPYLPPWSGETIFTDAQRRGAAGFAILNDLYEWHNGVTARMLADATIVPGTPLFRGPAPTTPDQGRRQLYSQFRQTRAALRSTRPCVAWAYVELDHRLHRYGFDDVSEGWLQAIQRLAEDLVDDGWGVALHSDHGIVPTTHNPELRADLESLVARFGGGLGGAGRTCWVTVGEESAVHDTVEALEMLFGSLAEVVPRDAVFAPGSLGWQALGNILVIARGAEFATPDRAPFEHGSRTPSELEVPVMVWEP